MESKRAHAFQHTMTIILFMVVVHGFTETDASSVVGFHDVHLCCHIVIMQCSIVLQAIVSIIESKRLVPAGKGTWVHY